MFIHLFAEKCQLLEFQIHKHIFENAQTYICSCQIYTRFALVVLISISLVFYLLSKRNSVELDVIFLWLWYEFGALSHIGISSSMFG